MDSNSEHSITFAKVIFWLLWIAALLIIPLYGFFLVVELSTIKATHSLSYLSPVIGVAALIAQIVISTRSFQQAKQVNLLSKAYLTLLGGTLIVALISAGGCASMGSLGF